jgi:hypothetical protein
MESPSQLGRLTGILIVACTFLLFLIGGQGFYLFRLEAATERTRQETETLGRMLTISCQLLDAEVGIPYELARWEQSQLGPSGVPEPLQSTYRSWNTVRLSRAIRAASVFEGLQERFPPDSPFAAVAQDLESRTRDLEARYKGRVRADVLAELEGE